MWWRFISTTHKHTHLHTSQVHSLNPALPSCGNVYGTWKTNKKQKVTHLHVQSSETHEDWNWSGLKIYFIKNRSQLKIVKINMATTTGNKKQKKKKSKCILLPHWSSQSTIITHTIAFSYFCMKMRQFGKKPELNSAVDNEAWKCPSRRSNGCDMWWICGWICGNLTRLIVDFSHKDIAASQGKYCIIIIAHTVCRIH